MTAMAGRKKGLTYKGKPIYKIGDRIYYGNLDDRFILVLDIIEKKNINGQIETASKIKVQLMDNTGKFGEGQVYRKAERTDLFHAFDIGEWWLQDALDTVNGASKI